MFLALRAEVENGLGRTLTEVGYPADDLGLERPPEDVDAVLASSVAFRLAAEAEAAPPAVAGQVAEDFDVGDCEYVVDVETRGPYVNFLAGERYIDDTLGAAQADDYGTLDPTGTSVVVEHTSANPTGPIHVGRARNPIIGDALARVLDYAGHDVECHYYVNDAGRQIAVLTWAYETFDESDLPEPERDSPEYDLVRYYRKGNTYLEEGDPAEVEAAEEEIGAILRGLENGDEEVYKRVSEVVDAVLAGMRATLGRLPAEFDEFVKETRFVHDGSTDDIVDRLQDLEATVYEDGAWQLEFEDIEKNLVFLRADGTSLYTTRDLAHHEWKFTNFDRAVTVLGEDHKLQAEQLRSALESLGHDTDCLRTAHYSWVNLPESGMSTREGTGIDLNELLDEAVERARGEVENRIGDRVRDDDLTDADVERIAHQVGVGAVRYDIVAKQPSKGITFEWKDALDFEAQSAPYVQYTHARACGILEEARAAGNEVPRAGADAAALERPEARELVRVVARFPAAIAEAAEDLRPHVVATYTRAFAEAFNAFYRECPVLDAGGETRQARLAVVVAARNAIANALDALGVAAPESM